MKTAIFLTLLLVTFLQTESAQAMGSKRPAPNPTPKPLPAPEPPTIDLGEDLDTEAYLDISSIIGPSVDQYYNNKELSEARSSINQDNVDKCFIDNQPHDIFSDQISYYAAMMFKDTPAMVGGIGSYYGTSENNNSYFPTSLIRHPLCSVSSSTLSKTMRNVPGKSTIDKLNRFGNKVNTLRSQVINGDMTAKIELLHTWGRFFSCLAYTESLSSADSSNSIRVAQKYAPPGYRKPAAVEFYEDPAQPAESKLNIGMFQFTPTASGNISPCIKAWNALHKSQNLSCQINRSGNQGEMIKVLGSSLQSFNAFCGVHKLIQTFSIQVNTNKTSATHPSNIVNGKFLRPENRCVSPHFAAGKAYNHFGPFQNSTGSNMDKFFSCIEKSQN